jgi:hypothetical protein
MYSSTSVVSHRLDRLAVVFEPDAEHGPKMQLHWGDAYWSLSPAEAQALASALQAAIAAAPGHFPAAEDGAVVELHD